MKKDINMDDREFEFACNIMTGDGSISISNQSIRYMEICESIFNVFVSGMMAVNNTEGIFDDLIVLSGDIYSDIMYFELYPKDSKGKLPEEIFRIKYAFSIYRSDDATTADGTTKVKRLFFRSIMGQRCREMNNIIPAGDYVGEDEKSGISVENMSDNQRSVLTGNILKALFIGAGFDKDKSFKKDDEENDIWDDGKHAIFPPMGLGDNTIFDTIKYIHSKHISAEDPNDFCLLGEDRQQKIYLQSISKLFKEAKDKPEKYNLETVVIGNVKGVGGGGGGKSEVGNVVVGDLSQVRSYKYTDPSSDYLKDTFVINIPAVDSFGGVARYDLGTESLKKLYEDKYKKYYVEPFGGEPMFAYNTLAKHLTTTLSRNYASDYKNVEFAIDVEYRAKLLKILLFETAKIEISLRGSSHRTCAKFIDIGSTESIESARIKKIVGKWFITECTHVIDLGKYSNVIKCVKTYV
jgi:hypothetical protein